MTHILLELLTMGVIIIPTKIPYFDFVWKEMFDRDEPELLRIIQLNAVSLTPQLRVVRSHLQRITQAEWLDLYDPKPFHSHIREACTLLELELSGTAFHNGGVAEDCSTAGLPNLANRLEFMFSFYREIVGILKERGSHCFDQYRSCQQKLDNSTTKAANNCASCSRSLRLEHLKYLEKPCITATTDDQEIKRLQSDYEAKQKEMEQLIQEQLCPVGMESYFHNLKNLIEQKEFYLKKSSSDASAKLREVLDTLMEREDDYMKTELKASVVFASEDRLEAVRKLSREIQKKVRELVQSKMKEIVAKYASTLAARRISELKYRMVSSSTQTDEWRVIDTIKQLEARNVYLVRTFVEEKEKAKLKDKQLLEQSRRNAVQQQTNIALTAELNEYKSLRMEGMQQLELTIEQLLSAKKEVDQNTAHLSAMSRQLQETRACLYSMECLNRQLQQKIYVMANKHQTEQECQTEPKGTAAATQTEKAKTVMFSENPIESKTNKDESQVKQVEKPLKQPQSKRIEAGRIKSKKDLVSQQRKARQTTTNNKILKKRNQQQKSNTRFEKPMKTQTYLRSQSSKKPISTEHQDTKSEYNKPDAAPSIHGTNGEPSWSNGQEASHYKSTAMLEKLQEIKSGKGNRQKDRQSIIKVKNIAGTLKALEQSPQETHKYIDTVKTMGANYNPSKRHVEFPPSDARSFYDRNMTEPPVQSIGSASSLEGEKPDHKAEINFVKKVKPLLAKERFASFKVGHARRSIGTREKAFDTSFSNMAPKQGLHIRQRGSSEDRTSGMWGQLIRAVCEDLPEEASARISKRLSFVLEQLTGGGNIEASPDSAFNALKILRVSFEKHPHTISEQN